MVGETEARPGSERAPSWIWALWLLTSAGIALLATPYYEWAYPFLLLMFFVSFGSGQSGAQLGTLRRRSWLSYVPAVAASTGAAVAILMSSWGNLWFAWLPASTGLNVIWRFVWFERVGYTRYGWVDSIMIFSAFPIYLIGGLSEPHSTIGWLALAPTVPFAGVGLAMVVQRQRLMRRAVRGALRVGDEAPDFTLKDHRGEAVTLSAFRGGRPVLLFFVRGDWCPGCHIMLRSYQKNRAKFEAKNTAVLAIGPDPIGVNREMVESLGLEYGLLSDDSLEVAKQYGVLLEGRQPGVPYDAGMPTPTSFLIDEAGVIRFSSKPAEVGMILQPEAIFPALEQLEGG